MSRRAAREVSEHCACLKTRRTSRLVTRAYDEAMRPYGLRVTQFTILAAFTLTDGKVSLSDMADRLDMERSTLSRNVKLLEDKGWLTSSPTEHDARARAVRITEAGRAVFDRALPAWRSAQDDLRETLGAEGWRALQEAERRLHAS